MNVARRLTKLETIRLKSSPRRFLICYENPDTGMIEPSAESVDENATVWIVQCVKPIVREHEDGNIGLG